MAGDSKNIVVGAATFSTGAAGASPTFADVGFTKEGVRVACEREYVDVMGDQHLGVLKKVKSSIKVKVSTTLLESTLGNLAIAWDYDSVADLDEAAAQNLALKIVGPGPNSTTRTVTLHKAVSTAEGEMAWKRDEEQGLEVEFDCLPDHVNNSGKWGTIADASSS